MRPGSDGSFSAIEVIDQIGFASGENGSGKVCSTIQTSGSRIASENRFSNCAVDASSVSAPFAAVASMMATTIATACCAKAPLAIARIGVAASNMVRREEAIDKMGDFEAGLGSRPGWISPRRVAGCDYRISRQATPTPSADHIVAAVYFRSHPIEK